MFKCHKFSGALIGRRMLHICFNGFSNLKQPSTVFFKSLPLKVNKTTPGIPGYDAIIILTPWIYKPLDKNYPYQHPSTRHPEKYPSVHQPPKLKPPSGSCPNDNDINEAPHRQGPSPTKKSLPVVGRAWNSMLSGAIRFDMDHAIPIFSEVIWSQHVVPCEYLCWYNYDTVCLKFQEHPSSTSKTINESVILHPCLSNLSTFTTHGESRGDQWVELR